MESHGLERAPASSSQARLLFLEEYAPGRAVHNLTFALRLRGAIEVSAIHAALEQIHARHQILRTTYDLAESAAVPVLEHASRIDLASRVLAPSHERAPLTELLRLASDEAKRPIDLVDGPLLRAILVPLGEDDHALIVATHQIAFDRWSIDVFVNELRALLDPMGARELAPISRQYADYATFERHGLDEPAFATHVHYWKTRLAATPPLELPTDRPRPRAQSFHGARHAFAIPAPLSSAVRARATREGGGVFPVLLAAFGTLLGRYSGQTDVVVGTQVPHRHAIDETLIGPFMNTLALRLDLSADPTVGELLARARTCTSEALAHQDVPFDRVVAEVNVKRDESRNPLFQAMLVLVSAPPAPPGAPVSVIARDIDRATAMIDLTLSVEDDGDALACFFEYATDLFDASTIARLSRHFVIVLEAIVGARDAERVARLPLLADEERRQIVHTWNDTRARFDTTRCIHQLFEAQAERTPDAVALVLDDAEITYRELEGRANSLARTLIDAGVGPGVFVGVCLDRGAPMIVALMAILKAGGAYVPLDPTYPEDRLEGMIRDARAAILLTESKLADALSATAAKVVLLDTLEHAPTSERPAIRATPNDVAYVIYTSGSTGRPKGVFVQHRAVINLVEWVNRTYGVSATDRLLFVTSLSFDLSVYDIFGILAAGGSVRVVAAEDVRDPARLLEMLAREKITFWDSAPAMLQNVAHLFPRDPLPAHALRLVFLSGDWVPVALPDQVRATFPGANVVALGGATEATVWSNHFPIDVVDPGWTSIPYGRPMVNAHYHVLDAELAPCPIGVAGDLYIGGECLSLGYWNDPTLTASKYVPDPFSEDPGARLYRTGDRARYWTDGNLEFLGRLDGQVKIRGFRIELGEIESVLQTQQGVREAIVVAHGTGEERRLVAYVVPDRDAIGDADEDEARWAAECERGILPTLRIAIGLRLPEYMTPSAFVFLKTLPLSPTGKVDRKALPEPTVGQKSEFVEPTTPTEKTLAEIWRELLKVPRVGRDDDFFELGGHSLVATRMVARIMRELGVTLPLRAVFEAPRIAAMAVHVDQLLAQKRPTADRERPIERAAPDAEPALAYEEEVFWRWELAHPGTAGWSGGGAQRLSGPLDVGALRRAFSELARRNASLRTGMRREATRVVRVVSEDVEIPLEVIDLRSLGDADKKAQLDAQIERVWTTIFDLGRPPLLRWLLVRLEDEEHVLAFGTHHLVLDGSARQAMIDELRQLYAWAVGAAPAPPEPALQMADYAAWQRSHAQSAAMKDRLAFWRRTLAGAKPVALTGDLPYPAARSLECIGQPFQIERALAERLKKLASAERTSLSTVLTAGVDALLYRTTGQHDLVVATVTSTRESHPELAASAGNLIDHALLRADLSGNPSFHEIVRRVRDATVDALANVAPLGLILDDAASPLDHPFMRVVLNHRTFTKAARGQAIGELVFDAQNTAPLRAPIRKFDLFIIFAETGFGLNGRFVAARDLFDRPRIETLASEFVAILESCSKEPSVPLSDVRSC